MNKTFVLVALLAIVGFCSAAWKLPTFKQVDDAIADYKWDTNNPQQHKDNLRHPIKNRFATSIKDFTYVDVIIRVPIRNLTIINPINLCQGVTTGITTKAVTTGTTRGTASTTGRRLVIDPGFQDPRLTLIDKAVDDVTKAATTHGCEIIHSSDDLLKKGDLFTNSFEMGIQCPDDNTYLSKLVEDKLFYSNVMWAGNGYQLKTINSKGQSILSGPIRKKVDPMVTKKLSTNQNEKRQGRTQPPLSPPPTRSTLVLGPVDPWIPISRCQPSNNPHSNWYADALNTPNLDCNFINESDAYNKGNGGKIFMIDTGVYRAHPEFDGQNVQTVCVLPFASYQPYGLNCHDDDVSHGTTMAGIAVGKTLGIVKKATLVSYKVFGGDPATDYGLVEPAVKKAIDHIYRQVTTICPQDARPSMAMTGLNFIYFMDECFSPNNQPLAGPGSFGGPLIDCTIGMMAKLLKLISNGVVLQMPIGNGWINDRDIDASAGEIAFPVGMDICHYGSWKMNYDPSIMGNDYYPAFSILDGNVFESYGVDSRLVRPFRVGANDKYGKARSWLKVYDNGVSKTLDIGASNWGNNNCMDWSAPSIEVDKIAVIPNTVIDSWNVNQTGYDPAWNVNGSLSLDGYHGGAQGFKSSATSWAVPMAASSILSALVDKWSILRPTSHPDYLYPKRVHKFITINNLDPKQYYTSDHIDLEYYVLREYVDPTIPMDIGNVTSRQILLRGTAYYG